MAPQEIKSAVIRPVFAGEVSVVPVEFKGMNVPFIRAARSSVIPVRFFQEVFSSHNPAEATRRSLGAIASVTSPKTVRGGVKTILARQRRAIADQVFRGRRHSLDYSQSNILQISPANQAKALETTGQKLIFWDDLKALPEAAIYAWLEQEVMFQAAAENFGPRIVLIVNQNIQSEILAEAEKLKKNPGYKSSNALIAALREQKNNFSVVNYRREIVGRIRTLFQFLEAGEDETPDQVAAAVNEHLRTHPRMVLVSVSKTHGEIRAPIRVEAGNLEDISSVPLILRAGAAAAELDDTRTRVDETLWQHYKDLSGIAISKGVVKVTNLGAFLDSLTKAELRIEQSA